MAAVSSMNIIESTCFRPWEVKKEPFAITDQLFYIGNQWVGAYLIDTGEGLFLLDTTTAETAYQVLESIHVLGYDPKDIKKILLSHAHTDHYGAARILKEISGAEIWLSREDERFRHTPAAAEVGGLSVPFHDYEFETDCFYDEKMPVQLGTVTIETRLTPGHTPGTTTFFIHLKDSRMGQLTAAMHGGVGVLTMTDESMDRARLPHELRKQFIRDCHEMEEISVDICLPSHPAHGKLFEIRERQMANPEVSFIDRRAWKEFLVDRVRFAEKLEKEAGASFAPT